MHSIRDSPLRHTYIGRNNKKRIGHRRNRARGTKKAIPVGIEPTIFCLGGRRVSIAPRDHIHKGQEDEMKR